MQCLPSANSVPIVKRTQEVSDYQSLVPNYQSSSQTPVLPVGGVLISLNCGCPPCASGALGTIPYQNTIVYNIMCEAYREYSIMKYT